MIGLIIGTSVVLGGLAAIFGGKKSKKPPGPVGKVGGFEVVTAVTAGAKDTDPLPMIILLHADLSTAAEALPLLANFDQPVRIVVPVGSFTKNGMRAYVDPSIDCSFCEPRRKALRDEAVKLQDFIVAAQAAYPNTGRVIVVGLGESGALAVALGLFAPPLVRQAFGIGGVFEADWVPLASTWANEIRKLTYGDAIGYDQLGEETAVARGFDYQVTPIDQNLGPKPDPDLVRDWLTALVNLEKP